MINFINRIFTKKLKGYAILSIFVLAVFVIMFLFSIAEQTLAINSFVKKNKEAQNSSKKLYEILKDASKKIFDDTEFLYDYKNKYLFVPYTYEEYSVEIASLSHLIPINVLPFAILKNLPLFDVTDLEKITTYRALKDFIYSNEKIEEITGKKYGNLSQQITYYTLINPHIIDEYVFARLYVYNTGLFSEFDNAANYFLFNKNSFSDVTSIEDFETAVKLENIEALSPYLTFNGIINISMLDDQYIRLILEYFAIDSTVVQSIVSKKTEKHIMDYMKNILPADKYKIIKNIFATYSMTFLIKITENNQAKSIHEFILFKIIIDKQIKYVRLLKKL